jgi:FixJ family two-component response regulator
MGSMQAAGHQLGSYSIPGITPDVTPIVFVVDEDPGVRDTLELLISSQGWQPETFESTREFLLRPRPLVPSCLVLALSANDLGGLELQRRIARERGEMPIIIISGCEDIPTTVQAMKAGAVDFFVKPFSDDVLLSAIRQSLERSEASLPREIEILDFRSRYSSLTLRERQVMKLVVSGLLNKQVGGELGISEITVKAHRGKVMQKMKANSLPDLVKIAAKLQPSWYAVHLA